MIWNIYIQLSCQDPSNKWKNSSCWHSVSGWMCGEFCFTTLQVFYLVYVTFSLQKFINQSQRHHCMHHSLGWIHMWLLTDSGEKRIFKRCHHTSNGWLCFTNFKVTHIIKFLQKWKSQSLTKFHKVELCLRKLNVTNFYKVKLSSTIMFYKIRSCKV